MKKQLVFICSPYRGDVEVNLQKARNYCHLAFVQGDRMSAPIIPFAPHLLFTQFLDDSKASERDAGLCLGLSMLARCDQLWVFGAPTQGMALEIQEAKRLHIPIRSFDAEGNEVIARAE
ncbi:MAG: DUF4406 domain-containing protein [Clostridia bacterium]